MSDMGMVELVLGVCFGFIAIQSAVIADLHRRVKVLEGRG